MKRWLACALVPIFLLAQAAAQEIDLFTTPAPTPAATTRKTAGIRLSEAALIENTPIEVNCAAALLAEADTGQVIFEMNADVPRPAASITKVMTILLTLEAIEQGRISIDQRTTISKNASGMGGSQVLLDTGEVQTVDVLLKSVIVGSANDACVALAELMYGSEELCVKRMNERAAELGMTGTHFVNSTGLPAEGQHTTARDIALMTMAMIRHPLYFEYSGIWLDEVAHEGDRMTQLTNTNKLIRLYDGCDGGKTGSTSEAGYCISATAQRAGMRLIAIVLCAGSSDERFEIAQDIFDYGFANYRIYPVARRGTKIRGKLPVQDGQPDAVSLYLDDDLRLVVSKGSEQNITLEPELPPSLTAPVLKGELAGYVCVKSDGRTLARLCIRSAEASQVRGLKNALSQLFARWVIDP